MSHKRPHPADKPRKRQHSNSNHTNHELHSLPLRVRQRGTAYRAGPICSSHHHQSAFSAPPQGLKKGRLSILPREKKKFQKIKRTTSRGIALPEIHPKTILIETAQLPRASHSRNIFTRIVDNQRIRLRQQRRRARLIGLGVPMHAACTSEAGVVAEGVGRAVGGAGDEDVDVGGGDGEGGVVPAEGYGVADFVVGCLGEGGGGEEVDAAGWEAGVDGGGLG